MPRKKVADMSEEELEKHRAYMREAKRKSRKLKPDVDNRDRSGYMRKYMRNKRKNAKKDNC